MIKAPDESIKDETVVGDISPTVVPVSVATLLASLAKLLPPP